MEPLSSALTSAISSVSKTRGEVAITGVSAATAMEILPQAKSGDVSPELTRFADALEAGRP
jgi:hypothetical protein